MGYAQFAWSVARRRSTTISALNELLHITDGFA
jgi:hypothetical protein